MNFEVSRRTLMQAAALIGLAACSAERSTSAATRGGASTSVAPAGDSLTRRLERSTFGVTPELRAAVDTAGGFESWLDQQLSDRVPTQDHVTKRLADVEARLPQITGGRIRSGPERAETTRLCVETITGRTVFGAAFGPDQLRQRVIDVLADLLHVTSSTQPEIFGVCAYDSVLRAGAFGRFSDVLLASARQPAMLAFLDQAASRADGGRAPNENYARELMELHTIGVDGGYDEQDVIELAHVLSGWTVDRHSNRFEYRAEWHALGPFRTGHDIVGWQPDTGEVGEAAGISVIEHLARHPSTARRLAHVFARRFISEQISREDELVREAAEVYTEHDTAIGPMLRHLLTSERFSTSATLMLRRPVDLVAHAFRVAGADAPPTQLDSDLALLVGVMNVLGHVPYGWPSPNGYPTSSAAWSNAGAMISRWNAMVTFVDPSPAQRTGSADKGGLQLDPAALGAASPAELVAALCRPEHQVY
ncbi:MAG TPA: DUF1800 domain-containing protein [Microthrixaceae bacterium]|nr:DUF1800 domain-containing protein [Microthrixaceae bacterium]